MPSAHVHNHPFKFYRLRGGTETRIYPHAGARLHFGSREADSLSLPMLPVGALAAGDMVKVTYLETTVFIGTVEKRVLRKTGGSEQTENVTVLGPWSKMARLVYRQGWLSMGAAARSSRLILNQTQGGAPQTLNSELGEIARHAATACGYSVGNVSVSTQTLPSDECRDITVADAIRRELRLFPKAVARFDYSSGTPTLVINKGQAASYAVADKTDREIEYDEHPITGVDLQIDESGEIDGVGYLNITHQTAGDATADNPDCLYATLQIRGSSSNTVRQSFESVTEDIPDDLNDPLWWKQKHPRLENVAITALEISEGTRTPTSYPRISAATAGELEEAGLHCEISKFSCKAKITTPDDIEDEIILTANFLTTNATGTAEHPKTYTWVAESSAESGETVPAGLASEILAERCGRIRSEKMTIRLGETFPAIGDMITDEGETIPLQSIDIDCADLTADLVFGAPEYLSPEDMAALLSNFRNKCTTWSSTLRKTGKTEDLGSNVEMGGIPPLSSTEFCPGVKAKTTVKGEAGTDTGVIRLDSAALKSGEKVEIHEITVKSDNGEERKVKVLATEDFTSGGVSPGVNSVNNADGNLFVIGGKGVDVTTNGKTIKISANSEKEEDDPDPQPPEGDPCAHPGDKDNAGGVNPDDDEPGGGGADPSGGGVFPSGDPHPGDDGCNCD